MLRMNAVLLDILGWSPVTLYIFFDSKRIRQFWHDFRRRLTSTVEVVMDAFGAVRLETSVSHAARV